MATRKNACIVGVGRSIISRDSVQDRHSLATDACIAAIEDAGLTQNDIDGIATHEMSSINGYKLQETLQFTGRSAGTGRWVFRR